MENNDKTSKSPSPEQRSKDENRRMWTKLTWQYLQDLPAELDVIKKRLETKDYAAIKKDVHRIKGTSGTFKLTAIAKTTAELELLADTQDPEAISFAIDTLLLLIKQENQKQDISERNPNERADSGNFGRR